MNKKKTVEELKQSIQELQKENKNLRENNAIVEQCTIQMREMFPEEWDERLAKSEFRAGNAGHGRLQD